MFGPFRNISQYLNILLLIYYRFDDLKYFLGTLSADSVEPAARFVQRLATDLAAVAGVEHISAFLLLALSDFTSISRR